MAGEGRTGKVGKRHQSTKSSGPSTLTRNDIRRLARRGGVKRISGEIYPFVRDVLREFLDKIIQDTIVYTEHANRVTVTTNDVVLALKRHGRTIYGYGM
jgi:histone H4